MKLRKVVATALLGLVLAGGVGMMSWGFYFLMGPWGLLVAALLSGIAGASGYAVAVWLD